MAAIPTRRDAPPVGRLLKYWRQVRRKSQLTLALEAEVSPRHLGFIEVGRARPSREMILTLAQALDVPLRERNELLLAAGFAPVYHETSLADPAMVLAREALDAILRQQEPFPAVVMDRYWNILLANDAASRLFGTFIDLAAEVQPMNVLKLMFDPAKVRPFVVNWDAVAEALLQRVHRETVAGVVDRKTTELLDELLRYPGVPRRPALPDEPVEPPPFLPVEFRVGDATMRYFSTVTTLGTPRDITLQEIRIESFFPGDAATAARARELAR
ncbi:MAG TPA: helix-turn-helix transcriptional regulator [Thermoanaerobaculia bacterium]